MLDLVFSCCESGSRPYLQSGEKLQHITLQYSLKLNAAASAVTDILIATTAYHVLKHRISPTKINIKMHFGVSDGASTTKN